MLWKVLMEQGQGEPNHEYRYLPVYLQVFSTYVIQTLLQQAASPTVFFQGEFSSNTGKKKQQENILVFYVHSFAYSFISWVLLPVKPTQTRTVWNSKNLMNSNELNWLPLVKP